MNNKKNLRKIKADAEVIYRELKASGAVVVCRLPRKKKEG